MILNQELIFENSYQKQDEIIILHLDSRFLKIDSENNMKFQKLKSKSSQKKKLF